MTATFQCYSVGEDDGVWIVTLKCINTQFGVTTIRLLLHSQELANAYVVGQIYTIAIVHQ